MRTAAFFAGILATFAMATGCVSANRISATTPMNPTSQNAEPPAIPPTAQTLVVGGGCFWCIEPLFEQLKGVYDVESGYAGGQQAGVTYDQVTSGRSGHAEVIKISFDPAAIKRDDLLRIFLSSHDPTTKDRQGNDVGTQYRSVIFFANPEEKALAERIIAELTSEGLFDKPIVTTIEELKNYTRAEEYHQDYYAKFEQASPEERARMNAGYCTYVITPKIAEFRKKFSHLFKDSD
jgi:peptide-methionine (S)-S-oxide reductase